MNLDIIYARLESRKTLCSNTSLLTQFDEGFLNALKQEIEWLESQIPQYYLDDLYAKSQGWSISIMTILRKICELSQ